MAKKYINWKTKGMNRDMSVSAFNPEFAFENLNLRLATNEGNTMMSWVNERGTKEMRLHIDTKPWASEDKTYENEIKGTPIGTAVLNHQLVIFTVEDTNSYIYVLWKSKDKNNYDLEGKLLYNGDLGFKADYPIETLVSYESKNIQKVYWTDNLNQPRVINIAPSTYSHVNKYNNHTFDFVPELALKEEVVVSKIFGTGEFPAGVIQYAFTYYYKYGQESNIFYTTPLQYISYVDRGGSPDSKVANSFKITVSNVDTNFDYLRIYSILRTSKDGTPLVKRIQDIEISEDIKSVSYIDNGLSGDTVDPTELLYKGGDEIRAKTIEQKDGTLFLGNITVTRPSIQIKDYILEKNEVSKDKPLASKNILCDQDIRYVMEVSKEPLEYFNTLSGNGKRDYKGAAMFKGGEYYRLGVQFQYKNGKWSEPCWIGDKQEIEYPEVNTIEYIEEEGSLYYAIYAPEFIYSLNNKAQELWNAGYRKVRPVFALPKINDRTILCQGVGCPTMYRKSDRWADATKDNGWDGTKLGTLYAQASWLFRTPIDWGDHFNDRGTAIGDASNGGGIVSDSGALLSQYKDPIIINEDEDIENESQYFKAASPWIRDTEVMGSYDDGHCFYIDKKFITINSPDVEFDDSFNGMDFQNCFVKTIGNVTIDNTYGDIDIQLSTPPIGSNAAGFVHRSIVTDGYAALISGLYFNDYIVDDASDTPTYSTYARNGAPPSAWPVYMWHKNGSLNNDVSRDNRTAVLSKKKISNLRYCKNKSTNYFYGEYAFNTQDIQLFNSDQLSIVKVDGHVYMGNIETMLTPTSPSEYFFVGNPEDKNDVSSYQFDATAWWRIGVENPGDESSQAGLWYWTYGVNEKFELFNSHEYWHWAIVINNSDGFDTIGDIVRGLCVWREGISMKYKSTPHLVAAIQDKSDIYSDLGEGELPIIEVTRDYNKDTLFGGTSDDALQALTWIPCGPPTIIDPNKKEDVTKVYFKWGDTYFQRYDCLKTYPFTQEDKNQVVEIASFMVETRVNIDGRYDRNRAQTSNLNMTPKNFNLINPVYSQMDNFFSYKIMSEDYYNNVDYPNNITWTKTKQNGADVDLWTNLTLANMIEMDGDKGTVNKLIRFNNQLLAFQDSGLSQILYNENTQISTTEGVPIEIANSNKVQGKRYYSDTVGCSNKWSIVQTPVGIYFMDSNEKSIYMFNGQLNNLSSAGGLNSWAKQNIPAADAKWTPNEFSGSFVSYYDKLNQDVLFINDDKALAYSEKFNCFTSFYSYGNASYFNNLDDIEIWIKDNKLWQHQAGGYCRFFDDNQPFSMTLVANQEPQVDKMFTNLEFRACVDGEGTNDEDKDKFSPLLPFDTLEVWDEYQHGVLKLSEKLKDRNQHIRFTHGNKDGQASLDRKFRMWRCDIPRDNAVVSKDEEKMGIKRFKARPLDRIRNPWAYLKLTKSVPADKIISLSKTEVHDIMASYFA